MEATEQARLASLELNEGLKELEKQRSNALVLESSMIDRLSKAQAETDLALQKLHESGQRYNDLAHQLEQTAQHLQEEARWRAVAERKASKSESDAQEVLAKMTMLLEESHHRIAALEKTSKEHPAHIEHLEARLEEASTERLILEREWHRERALRTEAEGKVHALEAVVSLQATEAEVVKGLAGSPLDSLAGKCPRCTQLETELVRYRYRSLDRGDISLDMAAATAAGSPIDRAAARPEARSRSRRSAGSSQSRSPPSGLVSGSLSRGGGP